MPFYPFTEVFGQKPQVAPFEPTDPLKELGSLLGGEIKDWPQIEQLSNLYQTYMMGALNEAIPGFSDILKAGGTDTEALLTQAEPLIKGEIPPDVAQSVMRSAAFQSLGSGTMGSPMAGALTARDLGVTSLDLMSQGANLLGAGGNAAQRWAQIASGTILPPSSQLYSPEWFSTFMAQQRAAKQATQQLRYNVAAAPDPAAAGISGTIMNLLGAYLGHGMGGGGGSITPSYGSIIGSSMQQPGGAAAPSASPTYGLSKDTPYGVAAPTMDYGSTVPMPYAIASNPFNTPYNLGASPTDPASAYYYNPGG